jgi:hypothetical protein
METIKRYSKEEAQAIIAQDATLQADLKDMQKDVKKYKDGLDHGFEYGNYFSLYDPETNKVDKSKVVIQWCSDDECAADDTTFDYAAHELVATSYEEAVVILRDIENANGKIVVAKEN